ncbi:MAG: hypothetical protein ABIR27_01205, partial [Dokdonella sp.]
MSADSSTGNREWGIENRECKKASPPKGGKRLKAEVSPQIIPDDQLVADYCRKLSRAATLFLWEMASA